MNPAAVPDALRTALAKAGIAPDTGPLLVACSGGADSMALLHAVCAAGHPCIAAHFDHGLRGAESAADRDMVAAFAAAHDLPFEAAAWEAPGAGDGESVEMAARRARYGFLCATARARRCAAILTAHHADDQAETVLMRLLRGTSPDGLGAIPPMALRDGVLVLRPFLALSRAAIAAYGAEHGVPYREDATNADTSIPRNRIRHDLLPKLAADYNPAVREALARFAALQADENAWLEAETAFRLAEIADSEGAILRRRFSRLHTALQRRVLTAVLARNGLYPPYERIEAARRHALEGATGDRIDLGGGYTLVNTRGRCLVRTAETFVRSRQSLTALRLPGDTAAMGMVFAARFLPRKEAAVDRCSPRRQVFDADRLGPAAAVRRREDGDRFEPLGMAGTRKIQDCFVDWHVPQSERDQVPLLLAGGRIVWAVGYGVGRFAALTDATRRVVEVCVEPESI